MGDWVLEVKETSSYSLERRLGLEFRMVSLEIGITAESTLESHSIKMLWGEAVLIRHII